MLRAVIVEDEKKSQDTLIAMLNRYCPQVVVTGIADGVESGLKTISTLQPDLLFLDIQMPDLTGFEVIEQIDYKPNIIFTTAYEQYAIKAFESFSIDYLLKPIKEERLEQSIRKLTEFGKIAGPGPGIDVSGLQEIIRQLQAPPKATALPIKIGDRIILLRFEQIAYMEAEDKYVYIHTTEGVKHLTDHSLTTLSEKLPSQFYRIQKSYIINKDRIREMHRHFNGRYLFIMDDKAGTRLTSGRTYAEAIRAEFGL